MTIAIFVRNLRLKQVFLTITIALLLLNILDISLALLSQIVQAWKIFELSRCQSRRYF